MDLEWTELEYEVTPDQARVRLDLFLSHRFPVVNRTGWQERIHEGHVLVNGETARPSRKLHVGDKIRIEYQRKKEPEVNTDVGIIYRDSCLLVIDKPPNLPVHPSGAYHKNTLQHILIEKLSADDEAYHPRPVHRLDRETSGIMLLAESRACASSLARMVRTGNLEKEYLVIVEGDFPAEGDWLQAAGWIGPDPESEVRKKQRFWPAVSRNNTAVLEVLASHPEALGAHPESHRQHSHRPSEKGSRKPYSGVSATSVREIAIPVSTDPHPQDARATGSGHREQARDQDSRDQSHRDAGRKACHTDFKCLKQIHGLSLILCRLHTGRMHQIRATLQSLGFPVVGDRMYGVDPAQYLRFIHDRETPEQLAKLRMERVALHSHVLRIMHPESGKPMEFRSDLPADMQVIINQ
ncbi:MAG: hypothetical protein CMN76_00425 [Spirochaetaceae bacterium]|nr:hypothetical protein [Spirochaetaceae bacterium]|tara:strand:+ start:47373 stop:48599 length:1227 start_codon:yes stop_codon:yes gene_type:complete